MRHLVFVMLLMGALCATAVSVGCGVIGEKRVDATIFGSAENPDPVYERIQELKSQGKLEHEATLESYPAQYVIRASQEIVDELNAMPRKALSSQE